MEFNSYIYLYHLDEYLILPDVPDSINDDMSSRFSETNPLSRTAPIYSYSNSGPRTVQIRLNLHRDMLDDVNIDFSNFKLKNGEDYTDYLIRQLQSMSLPKYNSTNKSIVPPMVAVKICDDIFIKGIVSGSVSINYEKPILENNKYALVSVSFQVYETEPYDAESVAEQGSFRGITRQFTEGVNNLKANLNNLTRRK